MAKVFLVNEEVVVSTVREVSEILGTKVTKKAVVDGEVPGVQYIDQVDASQYLTNADTEDDIKDIAEQANSLLEEDIPEDTEDDTEGTEVDSNDDGNDDADDSNNDSSDSDDDSDNQDVDTEDDTDADSNDDSNDDTFDTEDDTSDTDDTDENSKHLSLIHI